MRALNLSTIARRVAAAVGGLVLATCGIFAVERTAHRDDAAQYWTMDGRLARTGDPFYVAAVDHKGPVWVAAYRFGYAITGDQRWFWFIIVAAISGLHAIFR